MDAKGHKLIVIFGDSMIRNLPLKTFDLPVITFCFSGGKLGGPGTPELRFWKKKEPEINLEPFLSSLVYANKRRHTLRAVNDISEFIFRQTSELAINFQVITLIHFGSNNIGAKNLKTRQSVKLFLEYFTELLENLVKIEKVRLLLSTIISRDNHGLTNKVKETNSGIIKACKIYWPKTKVIKTHTQFLVNCQPPKTRRNKRKRHRLETKREVTQSCQELGTGFATDFSLFKNDKLHLNQSGAKILTEAYKKAVEATLR